MRYILIILVFLSVGANAQMVIKAHANYRPYASPAVNLLLDDYPNAAAAYSLRKLDKDYTGSAIRVRRVNDNTEQDIGFTASGDLDTAALKSFGGSTSCGIVTWYDQSGNGRNLSQSTATRQPTIYFLGNVVRRGNDNKPAAFFNSINSDYLENATNGFSVNNISHYAVSSRGNDANELRTIYSTGILAGTNGFGFVYLVDDAPFQRNNIYQQIRTTTTAADVGNYTNTININNLIFGIGTSTTDYTYYNGGNERTVSHTRGNATSTGRISLGARLQENTFAPLFFHTGTISEVVFWQANQSSNRTGIENNINDYYNIYWNGDFAGLLDTYGSSAAAYSLRNLSSTYKGPLIRIRRSNDNAEQDIFGDYYGNLDTAALKTFVGANSGFVTTWYDQSGSSPARNATQSTAANQPRIALNGVLDRRSGDLALVYDGSNDYLENNSNGFAVNNVSHYAVSSRGNDANALRIIYSTGISAARDGFGFLYVPEDLPNQTKNSIWQQIRGGASVQVIGNYTNTINTNNLIFGIGTSTTDYTYYNGGNESTASHTRGNATSNGRIVIGSRIDQQIPPAYIHFLNGTTTEIVFWEANQSSNRTGIQNNINSYYSIY